MISFSKRKFITLSSLELNRFKIVAGGLSDNKRWVEKFGFIKLNTNLVSELLAVEVDFKVQTNRIDEFVGFATGKKILLIEKKLSPIGKSLIYKVTGKDVEISFEEVVMGNGNRYITIV